MIKSTRTKVRCSECKQLTTPPSGYRGNSPMCKTCRRHKDTPSKVLKYISFIEEKLATLEKELAASKDVCDKLDAALAASDKSLADSERANDELRRFAKKRREDLFDFLNRIYDGKVHWGKKHRAFLRKLKKDLDDAHASYMHECVESFISISETLRKSPDLEMPSDFSSIKEFVLSDFDVMTNDPLMQEGIACKSCDTRFSFKDLEVHLKRSKDCPSCGNSGSCIGVNQGEYELSLSKLRTNLETRIKSVESELRGLYKKIQSEVSTTLREIEPQMFIPHIDHLQEELYMLRCELAMMDHNLLKNNVAAKLCRIRTVRSMICGANDLVWSFKTVNAAKKIAAAFAEYLRRKKVNAAKKIQRLSRRYIYRRNKAANKIAAAFAQYLGKKAKCPICLEIGSVENPLISGVCTTCNMEIHVACAFEAHKRSSRCPVCRTQITGSHLERVTSCEGPQRILASEAESTATDRMSTRESLRDSLRILHSFTAISDSARESLRESARESDREADRESDRESARESDRESDVQNRLDDDALRYHSSSSDRESTAGRFREIFRNRGYRVLDSYADAFGERLARVVMHNLIADGFRIIRSRGDNIRVGGITAYEGITVISISFNSDVLLGGMHSETLTYGPDGSIVYTRARPYCGSIMRFFSYEELKSHLMFATGREATSVADDAPAATPDHESQTDRLLASVDQGIVASIEASIDEGIEQSEHWADEYLSSDSDFEELESDFEGHCVGSLDYVLEYILEMSSELRSYLQPLFIMAVSSEQVVFQRSEADFEMKFKELVRVRCPDIFDELRHVTRGMHIYSSAELEDLHETMEEQEDRISWEREAPMRLRRCMRPIDKIPAKVLDLWLEYTDRIRTMCPTVYLKLKDLGPRKWRKLLDQREVILETEAKMLLSREEAADLFDANFRTNCCVGNILVVSIETLQEILASCQLDDAWKGMVYKTSFLQVSFLTNDMKPMTVEEAGVEFTRASDIPIVPQIRCIVDDTCVIVPIQGTVDHASVWNAYLGGMAVNDWVITNRRRCRFLLVDVLSLDNDNYANPVHHHYYRTLYRVRGEGSEDEICPRLKFCGHIRTPKYEVFDHPHARELKARHCAYPNKGSTFRSKTGWRARFSDFHPIGY